MNLRNILLILGITLCVLGFVSLPLYNFHELPFVAYPGYAKGGGWKVLMQTGIFAYLGFILLVLGGLLSLLGILLSKTEEEVILDEIRKDIKKKNKKKN